MFAWLIGKLKEPSTQAGIAVIVGMLGAKFSSEAWQTIFSALIYVVAAIEVIRRELASGSQK